MIAVLPGTLIVRQLQYLSFLTCGFGSADDDQFSLHGLLDALFLKSAYALLINFVVIYLIFTVMNTISSSGLPGRQQRDDATSFAVCVSALLNTFQL